MTNIDNTVATVATVNNVTAVVATEVNGLSVVNLNKHDIVLATPTGDIVFPPSGLVATVSVKQVQVDTIGEIPVMGNEYGEVMNLPSPQDGVVFLVNALVLARVVGRQDCVAPDTGPSAIRESGQVKKVVRFVR